MLWHFVFKRPYLHFSSYGYKVTRKMFAYAINMHDVHWPCLIVTVCNILIGGRAVEGRDRELGTGE